MPRDAVSRTANVGTVGKNGLMVRSISISAPCFRILPLAYCCDEYFAVVTVRWQGLVAMIRSMYDTVDNNITNSLACKVFI